MIQSYFAAKAAPTIQYENVGAALAANRANC
jgi:hypothetical protein